MINQKNYSSINLLFFVVMTLLIMTLAQHSHAEFTQSKCSEVLTGNDVIQINRQWDADRRRCFMSVTPRKISDLKYRDYYFDNTGQFMVFNSYGLGPDSTHSGARSFFLFPQIEDYPDYSFEENGDILVKMVSGHQLRISGKDFTILSLSSGKVIEKPLSKTNQGGVEIQLKQGFWLDSGFKMGGLNLSNPSLLTRFKSANSNKDCDLKNKTFLDIASDGDFDFKLSAQEFIRFVKINCPQLSL